MGVAQECRLSRWGRIELHLGVWLSIAAWIMLFVSMIVRAARLEREAQMRDELRLEMKA